MYKNMQVWAKLYVRQNLSVRTCPKLEARSYVEKYANVNLALGISFAF